jgi:hypothetical protein
MEKKKPSAKESLMTGAKPALARARREEERGSIVHRRKKEQLFLCFWDIVLGNLPEGPFSHRRITKEDARSRVEHARQAGRLLCVSNEDLFAPYRKREARKHQELCTVLSEHFAMPLSLKDFVMARDHEGKPSYSITPLQCVQVRGEDRLLVVTCAYTMLPARGKALLNFQIAPDTVEFHLIEATA